MTSVTRKGFSWNSGGPLLALLAIAGGQWILTFQRDVRDGTWFGLTSAAIIIAAWFLVCYGFMLPFNIRLNMMKKQFPSALCVNALRVQDLIDGASLILSEQSSTPVLIQLPAVYAVKFDDQDLTIFRGIRQLTVVVRVSWAKVEAIELEKVDNNHRVRQSVTLLITSEVGLAAFPIVILGGGPAGAFIVSLKRRQQIREKLTKLIAKRVA